MKRGVTKEEIIHATHDKICNKNVTNHIFLETSGQKNTIKKDTPFLLIVSGLLLVFGINKYILIDIKLF